MTVFGEVDLRCWDHGAVITLGGSLHSYDHHGHERKCFAVQVPGMDSELTWLKQSGDTVSPVPIVVADPEDVFKEFVLPVFVVKRSSLTPAHDRQPYVQAVGRGPARTAIKVTMPDGKEGYTRYENQDRADPFDMSYELQIFARRRQTHDRMLMHVLKHYRIPWFSFKIIDSLSDVRHYDAGDISISDNSELADMADRMVATTVSFTVRGEVDIAPIVEMPAILGIYHTYSRLEPPTGE